MKRLTYCDLTEEEYRLTCEKLLNRGGVIFTPNGEIAARCAKDRELYELISSADLLLPDGIAVLLAEKWAGHPIKNGRKPGIECAELLLSLSEKAGKSVCFFGGKPGTAEKAAEKMRERFPSLRVCGTLDGYYPPEKEEEIARRIAGAHPDLVLAALGFPKQEKWIAAHRDKMPGTLFIGIGGSFDVWAGETKRAPVIFRRLGLEWLWRTAAQPKRLLRLFPVLSYLLSTLFCKN